MRISVFGIGYVGAVSAACLAKDGNSVVAVDPNDAKVAVLNAGQSPIVEPGLDVIIADEIKGGRLRATNDPVEAINASELSFVCVGTPSQFNGSLDTGYVLRAAEEIGAALKQKSDFHTVVVRSTILPGTMEDSIIPALERASGKQAGVGFGIAYYPEFLRESTAIKDYYEPGAIVFGAIPGDTISVDRLKQINAHIPTTPKVVTIRTAEAIKYTNNCWHALKISFSNEIGNICKEAGIDSHVVLDILCSDNRLNISKAYMKPGFAFGGSCLPKDLRALRFKARELDVATPLLDATLSANENQLRRAYDMVARIGSKKVGLVGLSFKAGTDDLRESPLVELAERLHGKGFDLRIFDPNVHYQALVGANLHYVRSHIPHLSTLLSENVESVCEHADVIVVGNKDEASMRAIELAKGKKPVIDLVRLQQSSVSDELYHGICW
ncbi:MAG TPA: UDP-glucose/GDP-mannose dehydrogenase family protein [Ancylobacter sp.]